MLMKRLMLSMLTFVLTAIIVAGCSTGKEKDSKLKVKVAYNVWVGSAGLYVADANKYFEEHGIDVELLQFASPVEAAQALLANKVDLAVTTLDTLVMMKEKEEKDNPLQMVSTIDVSDGADGIVASKDIKTLADLKGKQVAATLGAVNHFMLVHALQSVGLSESDVNLVNVAPEITGSTFISGKVDAAVTWEPFLSEAQSKGGNLLYTSADAPGLIVDVLASSKKFADAHPDQLKDMIKAIDQGIADFTGEKAGSFDTVAGIIGSKPEEVKDIATGLKLYTGADSKQMLVDQLEDMKKIAQQFSDFFIAQKLTEKPIDPETVFNPVIYQ
jgi:NitT/TauT family transport system substrate-binding protein